MICRVLTVAAAAALLAGTVPSRSDAAGICRKSVSAAGKQRVFWLARGSARVAWRNKVKNRRGKGWASWQRARGQRYRCKLVVFPFQSICVATARPCRRR